MNITRYLTSRFTLLLLAVTLLVASLATVTAIEYYHATGPQLAATMVEYA